MNQSQTAELKKVIHQAVPEILELKFGCEMLTPTKNIVTLSHVEFHPAGTSKFKDSDGEILEKPTKEYNDYICIKKDGGIYHYGIFGNDKILGRHIRLADVLVAIGKNKKSFMLREDGVISIPNFNYSHSRGQWNLLDDNLDHQSEPTKQFLYDVLVKK